MVDKERAFSRLVLAEELAGEPQILEDVFVVVGRRRRFRFRTVAALRASAVDRTPPTKRIS